MLQKNSRVALITVAFHVLIFVLLGLCSAKPSFAAIEQIERNDDQLLILEVQVNDHVRNKGMIGYMTDIGDLSKTVLPLSALSRSVSFSIRSNPAEGIAEGWFRTEKNSFYLDIGRGVVVINGDEQILPPDTAEAHFEDIYVRIEALEKWFDMQIKPDIGMLRLYVTSEEPFPFEEEILRKERHGGVGAEASSSAIPYDPKHFVPYDWWSYPSFVLQQGVQARKSANSTDATGSFSIQSSGDALTFGTKFLLAGDAGTDNGATIRNAQMTFQKSDPERNLLGILHAGKIEMGDVSFADVPLAVGQKRGRGISISSQPDYNYANSFGLEKYDLNGDAPIGWDAELYRNGYFIAFQEVSADGRYNFTDVDLVRGFNLFQIVLYGPEGQKITQTQRVVRGAEMRQEGEFAYDFSIGQPEADFLPIAENSRTSADLGASGQVSYGVKKYLTIGASVYTGQDNASAGPEAQRQSSASFSTTVAVKGVKTQAQIMRANEGRSAYSLEASTNVFDTSLSVGHITYDGFNEDDRDLKSTIGASASRNFGFMGTNLRIEKNEYQKKDDEVDIYAGISTRLGRVQLTNELDYTRSENEAQESFTGNVAALTNIAKWRVRGNLEYNLDTDVEDKLRGANLSATKSLSRISTLRLNADYNFASNLTALDARYTHQFDKYALDVNLGGTNARSYFGGVTVRTGLQADNDGKYHNVSARAGGLGSVGLRAYVDANANKQYDEGEKLIENLSFRSNRGIVDGKTDENGYLFVNGLTEGPTRFSLEQDSMPSIYLKPYEDYLDIIPRTGTTVTMDLGFEQLGEIDGFVYVGEAGKAMPGLEIILTNAQSGEEVASAISEYDGYYVFSALPLGAYKISVLPSWGDEELAPPQDVTLSGEASTATDRNFILPRSTLDVVSAQYKDDDEVGVVEPEKIEPASGGQSAVHDVVEDAPKAAPVVTDGVDVASGEDLRGLFIHIGSESDFKAAQDEQKRLWAIYPEILGDVPLYVYKINVGEKTYFRIVGAIDDEAQGAQLCGALDAQNSVGGCAVTKL